MVIVLLLAINETVMQVILAEAQGPSLSAVIKQEPDEAAPSTPLHQPPPEVQPNSGDAPLHPSSTSPAIKPDVAAVSSAVKPDLSATESASGHDEPDTPPEEVPLLSPSNMPTFGNRIICSSLDAVPEELSLLHPCHCNRQTLQPSVTIFGYHLRSMLSL